MERTNGPIAEHATCPNILAQADVSVLPCPFAFKNPPAALLKRRWPRHSPEKLFRAELLFGTVVDGLWPPAHRFLAPAIITDEEDG